MPYPLPPPDGGYGPPPGYGGYGPPPGYGPYGPYGYQIEHPRGTQILVIGILSLVICAVVGPFAWKQGNEVLAEIDAQPGRFSNRGHVVAGRVCGMIGTAVLAFQVVVWGGIFLAMAFAAAASN